MGYAVIIPQPGVINVIKADKVNKIVTKLSCRIIKLAATVTVILYLSLTEAISLMSYALAHYNTLNVLSVLICSVQGHITMYLRSKAFRHIIDRSVNSLREVFDTM